MSPAVAETWFVDCEWGFRDGRIDRESAFVPVVFRPWAENRASGDRSGGDNGLETFIDNCEGDLFVSHNIVAEMKFLLRLGIALPRRWFDTYAAFRAIRNEPGVIEAGLVAALVGLGLPYSSSVAKGDAADDPTSAVRRRRRGGTPVDHRILLRGLRRLRPALRPARGGG